MSKRSVSPARRIVRYPDVIAHVTTCTKCKADGGEDLIYEIGTDDDGRGCAEGRRLDRHYSEAFSRATLTIREAVKRLVQHGMETLGVDARSITEAVSEALDEVLDQTGDAQYARQIAKVGRECQRVGDELWLRRQLDSLGGRQ
jgi:hypothetical protein